NRDLADAETVVTGATGDRGAGCWHRRVLPGRSARSWRERRARRRDVAACGAGSSVSRGLLRAAASAGSLGPASRPGRRGVQPCGHRVARCAALREDAGRGHRTAWGREPRAAATGTREHDRRMLRKPSGGCQPGQQSGQSPRRRPHGGLHGVAALTVLAVALFAGPVISLLPRVVIAGTLIVV